MYKDATFLLSVAWSLGLLSFLVILSDSLSQQSPRQPPHVPLLCYTEKFVTIETELPCVFENKKEFSFRDLGDSLTQCANGRQPCVVIT